MMNAPEGFVRPPIAVVMGVSGSGKTTVGQRVADGLGLPFVDADDVHSPANVAKMMRGEALDDADRAPWLATLRALLAGWRAAGQGGVLACSALKASYRETLDVGGVAFCLLTASPETLRQRLHARPGHFFDPDLLGSQLATLEATPDLHLFDTERAPPGALARGMVAVLKQAGEKG